MSKVLITFYYVTNIFDLHTFYNKTFHGNEFCFFFFLNERNITTSPLMMYLKCTVVYYANLNPSSINKPYLLVVECVIQFFSIFLSMFILTRLLSKTLRKNYHFLTQVFKTHFKM